MEGFLGHIKVKVFYDKKVREITKKDFEEMVVSEGMSFVQCLYFIFSSYPEIQKEFLPGQIGFSVNGKLPTEHDIINNGDEIKLMGFK